MKVELMEQSLVAQPGVIQHHMQMGMVFTWYVIYLIFTNFRFCTQFSKLSFTFYMLLCRVLQRKVLCMGLVLLQGLRNLAWIVVDVCVIDDTDEERPSLWLCLRDSWHWVWCPSVCACHMHGHIIWNSGYIVSSKLAYVGFIIALLFRKKTLLHYLYVWNLVCWNPSIIFHWYIFRVSYYYFCVFWLVIVISIYSG